MHVPFGRCLDLGAYDFQTKGVEHASKGYKDFGSADRRPPDRGVMSVVAISS